MLSWNLSCVSAGNSCSCPGCEGVFFFQRWPRSPHCTCGATGGPLTNVFWLHCRQMTPMCLTGTKKTAFVQALDKSLDLPLAMREPWQPSLWLGHHITGFAASRGRCRGEVAQVRPRWNVPRFSGAGAAAFRLIGFSQHLLRRPRCFCRLFGDVGHSLISCLPVWRLSDCLVGRRCRLIAYDCDSDDATQ